MTLAHRHVTGGGHVCDELYRRLAAHHGTGGGAGHTTGAWNDNYQRGQAGQIVQTQGRWPANVVLDEAAGALLDAQSGERPGCMSPSSVRSASKYRMGKDTQQGPIHSDTGGDPAV